MRLDREGLGACGSPVTPHARFQAEQKASAQGFTTLTATLNPRPYIFVEGTKFPEASLQMEMIRFEF